MRYHLEVSCKKLQTSQLSLAIFSYTSPFLAIRALFSAFAKRFEVKLNTLELSFLGIVMCEMENHA